MWTSLAAHSHSSPANDVKGITHLWLRTPSTKMKRQGVPNCSLTTGRGVRVIMLHPWPADHVLPLGRQKPAASVFRTLEHYEAVPHKAGRAWFAAFNGASARRYCVEALLSDCVGDHLHRRRHGLSGTSKHDKRLNSFAENYSRQHPWDESPG